MIPATPFVENAINEPFTKRPGLGRALAKVTDAERNKFLGSLLRSAPKVVDDDSAAISFGCDYYTLPKPSDDEDEEIPDLPDLIDVVAYDEGDAGKEKLAEWFDKMSSAAQRTPLYNISSEAGMVKEPKAESEELPADEQADVDALAQSIQDEEKEKKKKNRIFGHSPPYGALIMTDAKLLVPYSEDTINTMGNQPSSRFSTIISFSAHEFLPGHIHMAVNLCYGSTNIQIAYIKIPLRNITNEPATKAHETEQVAAYLNSLHISNQVGSGAYIVHLALDSSDTTILFKEQAFRDLHNLGMPYLPGLRRNITKAFNKKKINLTIFVPNGWTEFKPWVQRLSMLREHSLRDPLRPLKKNSRGQPINRKNYTQVVSPEIPFAPALTVFEDVDQFLTIHGDAITHKHK